MASREPGPLTQQLYQLAGIRPAATPDADLLERFVTQRDEAAFEMLVRRHGPMVLGLCRRLLRDPHDAEDAFQSTFLVFVRKARSLRRPERLGPWLHGVAYRTALKARTLLARRRDQPREVMPMPVAATVDEIVEREMRGILDAELTRLPEKYRVPVVLCYLEGKSKEEAARELGWPHGTVSSRLARALELLRKRLGRRGLALTAGALGTVLSQAGTPAAVAAPLRIATVKAGLSMLAGRALAGGVVSTPVATLTRAVLTTLFLSRLKAVAVVLLTLGVTAAGTGLLTWAARSEPRAAIRGASELRPLAGGEPQTRVASPKPAAEEPARDTRPISVRGKASDPAGKPIRGAIIYLVALNAHRFTIGPPGQDTVVATTTTDEQGRYAFQEARLPVIRSQADRPAQATFQVFGTAPGYGLTWQSMRFFTDQPRPPANPNVRPRPAAQEEAVWRHAIVRMDLTFRPATKVQGRVVDEAGRPLAQAKISLERGMALDLAGAGSNLNIQAWGQMSALPGSVRTTFSGQDGRFRLDGVPPDTVLQLLVEHQPYAAMTLYVATTPRTVPEGDKDLFQRAEQRWHFLTGDLALTFAASRQLTLQTIYADTGKPAANVWVHVNRIKEPTTVWATGKTDTAGRVPFRLPPGEYEADALPPAGEDYIRTRQAVKVAREPVEQAAEVRLRQGCVLILEAVDADTGKGIPGVAFLQEADDTPGLMVHVPAWDGRPDYEKDVTDGNGKLRAVVPPGKRRYAVDTRRAGSAMAKQVLEPLGGFSQSPRIELAAGQTLTLQFEFRKRRLPPRLRRQGGGASLAPK